jgi:hypothetical protein
MLGIKRLNRTQRISTTTETRYTAINAAKTTATPELPAAADERTLQLRAMYARMAERQALMDAETEAARLW